MNGEPMALPAGDLGGPTRERGRPRRVPEIKPAMPIRRLGARSLTRFPAGGDLLHGHCLVTPGLPGPFVPLNRGSPRAISSG